MNEEARVTKQERTMKVNFNQKVPPLDARIIHSHCLFIGYFYIQFNYQKLHLASFFETLQRDDSTNYYNIHRFLIYQCIFHNCDTPYFEEFKIDQDLILAFKDVLVHHKDQYLDHLSKHTHVPIQYDQEDLISYTGKLIVHMLLDDSKHQVTPVTEDELIITLKNLCVINEHDLYYQATYTNSFTLEALQKLTHLLTFYTIYIKNFITC